MSSAVTVQPTAFISPDQTAFRPPVSDTLGDPLLHLRAEMPIQYDVSYSDRGSDCLLVVLSPRSTVALQRYAFDQNSLHVADRRLAYYTRSPRKAVSAILKFALASKVRRLIFVGSSKGGAGALLWSAIANGRQTGLDIQCIAFSPQTLLYPDNPSLEALPSYRKCLANAKRSDTDPGSRDFRKFGDIRQHIRGHAPLTAVFYSSGYDMDTTEARRVANLPGLRLFPIDLPFHGSITPFIRARSEASFKSLADKLYKDAVQDRDLAASLPERPEELLQALRRLETQNLSQLIASEISYATPARLKLHQIRNKVWRLTERFQTRWQSR